MKITKWHEIIVLMGKRLFIINLYIYKNKINVFHIKLNLDYIIHYHYTFNYIFILTKLVLHRGLNKMFSLIFAHNYEVTRC